MPAQFLPISPERASVTRGSGGPTGTKSLQLPRHSNGHRLPFVRMGIAVSAAFLLLLGTICVSPAGAAHSRHLLPLFDAQAAAEESERDITDQPRTPVLGRWEYGTPECRLVATRHFACVALISKQYATYRVEEPTLVEHVECTWHVTVRWAGRYPGYVYSKPLKQRCKEWTTEEGSAPAPIDPVAPIAPVEVVVPPSLRSGS